MRTRTHRPWAELPPELVQRVAALLKHNARLSLMHTCSGWYAAVAAGPRALLPAAVLRCPGLEVLDLAGSGYDCRFSPQTIGSAYALDADQAVWLVEAAACMSPRTWRVRIEGEAQPNTVVSMLLALPAGVRWLELDVSPCSGPLLPALARFRRLQELSITGNAAELCWGVGPVLGPAAVLAPLRAVCLDFRRPAMEMEHSFVIGPQVRELPTSAHDALPAATALHSLDLRVAWSGALADLCADLPGLRHLRLHLYECLEEHAVAAASMLAALTQLTSICLGVHSCSGSDLDSNYPNTDSDWEEVENWSELVRLPRLGALTALTELCLAGVAAPPPDFRQLRHLRRLTVVDAASGLDGDGDWWGAEGLGGLASLTRVEVLQHPGLPDPAVLASTPHPTEVYAPDSPDPWRAQLAALRPDVTIKH